MPAPPMFRAPSFTHRLARFARFVLGSIVMAVAAGLAQAQGEASDEKIIVSGASGNLGSR